jgi:hypothetical protein
VGTTETVRVHVDDMFDRLEPTDLSSLGHAMQTRQTVLAPNSSYKIRSTGWSLRNFATNFA